MQWLRRMNAFLELSLQRPLGFCGQSGFCCSFPGQLRQRRQFGLKVLPGDSVPQTVFKCEDVHLLLFDAQNLSIWEPNDDFISANVDREVLLQIEARFGHECSM